MLSGCWAARGPWIYEHSVEKLAISRAEDVAWRFGRGSLVLRCREAGEATDVGVEICQPAWIYECSVEEARRSHRYVVNLLAGSTVSRSWRSHRRSVDLLAWFD